MCEETLYFERNQPIPRFSDSGVELVKVTGCGCCPRQRPIPMPGHYAYCVERDAVIDLDNINGQHVCQGV